MEAQGFYIQPINMSFNIKFKKLSDNATTPTRGSAAAAGWDLYAACEEPVTIKPHEVVKISTDLSFELPPNTFAGIFPRSGLATKQGLRLANCTGICDADYRGPYIVALYNDSNEEKTVTQGDRIAQMILLPFYPMELQEVEELSDTERGEGGFGSTGK